VALRRRSIAPALPILGPERRDLEAEEAGEKSSKPWRVLRFRLYIVSTTHPDEDDLSRLAKIADAVNARHAAQSGMTKNKKRRR
jgi:hypothetical protein